MPELPEVETVRRELCQHILQKRITAVEVREPIIVKNDLLDFERGLEGHSFTSIRRIGKLLQFHLDNQQVMLGHLKMTGQFLYQDHGEIKAGISPLLYASQAGGKKTAGHFREQQAQKGLELKHTHVLFHFEDGSRMAFRDQRKFGYLKLIALHELEAVEARYGIDPMDESFTLENWHQAFTGRTKSIKAVLMDQQLIAGLGNIYADEICFRSGIRPTKSVAKISKKRREQLFESCQIIMEQAIKHKGTTMSDFTRPDGDRGNFSHELQVYGRGNQECLKCQKATIKKIQFLGRGTHYCPAVKIN